MPDLPIVDDLRRLVEAGSGTEEQENMAAAADVIEALAAELETVKGERDTWRERASINIERHKAEAQLAEANKALDEMQPHIDKIERCIRVNDEMGRVVEGQTEAAKAIADIARRAREAALRGDAS